MSQSYSWLLDFLLLDLLKTIFEITNSLFRSSVVPKVLYLRGCCGKIFENAVWVFYWVAVRGGKRLGGRIEGNEEGVVKDWKKGKEVAGFG